MNSFSDSNVWNFVLLLTLLLGSLMIANIFKRRIPFLKNSLIPNSVLGGIVILLFEWVYLLCTGIRVFESNMFGNSGNETLEMITYHCLALGFIASSLKTNGGKLGKKRAGEVFNTGLTTVGTYLLQGVVGMVITIISARLLSNVFEAGGLLVHDFICNTYVFSK